MKKKKQAFRLNHILKSVNYCEFNLTVTLKLQNTVHNKVVMATTVKFEKKNGRFSLDKIYPQ